MLDQQPAFLVGVTGHWDLMPEQIAPLQERVRSIFRLLRHGAKNSDGEHSKDAKSLLSGSYQLNLAGCDKRERVKEIYDSFLNDWPGLRTTPIIVLSSLAPGADQLVANVALEPEFAVLNFHVMAPTPFPVREFEPADDMPTDTYRNSSTFVRSGLSSVEVTGLQQEFDNIVARITQRNGLPQGFTVTLADDMQFANRKVWLNKCAADMSIQDRRRRRYQAAGEYIAAYSHLMLAIWDHIDDASNTAGTAATVHIRQTGLTPGLLPVASGLPLPLGPTLQLFTRRKSRRTAGVAPGQPDAQPEPNWTLRWLFPATERADVPELQTSATQCSCRMDSLQQGLKALSDTAHHLRQFAVRPQVAVDKAEEHLKTFLSFAPKIDAPDKVNCIQTSLATSSPGLLQKIKRVADFRRRATNEQYKERDLAAANIRTLFLLTLAAALLLDAFNHWHTQNEPHHTAHHAEVHHEKPPAPESEKPAVPGNLPAAEKATTSKAGDTGHKKNDKVIVKAEQSSHAKPTAHQAEQHPPTPPRAGFLARLGRLLLGGFGVYFVIRVLLAFHRMRPEQHEEKTHDLRAMAEGARVQMMWFIAGVGRSVSANYMLRQRGEFSWIRQAIRSIAMPYENIHWQFRGLSRIQQLQLLRCVFHNWVRGHKTNAQSNYFQKARDEQIHLVHFWHKLGSILVLSGIALSVLQVAGAVVDVVSGGSCLEFLASLLCGYRLCWLLLIPVAAGIYLSVQRSSDPKWSLLSWLAHFLEHWFHTKDPAAYSRSDNPFRQQMRKNFVIMAIPAIILAGFVFLLAVLLSRWSYLPSVGNVTTILSAVLLVCGGLSIAWPEKNLNSELAFQYGTMLQIFQLTANHLEVKLQRLAEVEAIASDRSAAEAFVRRNGFAGTDEELSQRIAAVQSDANDEFRTLVTAIQEVLFELGQEALDENAEWLILHRSRPLEPVMAG